MILLELLITKLYRISDIKTNHYTIEFTHIEHIALPHTRIHVVTARVLPSIPTN
jgi:hypothetical protein